jgi:hypothetical protein
VKRLFTFLAVLVLVLISCQVQALATTGPAWRYNLQEFSFDRYDLDTSTAGLLDGSYNNQPAVQIAGDPDQVLFPYISISCGQSFNYSLKLASGEIVSGQASIQPGTLGFYNVTWSLDGYTFSYNHWSASNPTLTFQINYVMNMSGVPDQLVMWPGTGNTGIYTPVSDLSSATIQEISITSSEPVAYKIYYDSYINYQYWIDNSDRQFTPEGSDNFLNKSLNQVKQYFTWLLTLATSTIGLVVFAFYVFKFVLIDNFLLVLGIEVIGTGYICITKANGDPIKAIPKWFNMQVDFFNFLIDFIQGLINFFYYIVTAIVSFAQIAAQVGGQIWDTVKTFVLALIALK